VLVARIPEVDALDSLEDQAKAADKGARAATETRNTTRAALRTWVGKLRKQAKTDLHESPELRPNLEYRRAHAKAQREATYQTPWTANSLLRLFFAPSRDSFVATAQPLRTARR
jgi:hypothetical protein